MINRNFFVCAFFLVLVGCARSDDCSDMQCLAEAYADCSAANFTADGAGFGKARYAISQGAPGEACELALTFQEHPNPVWNNAELLLQIPNDEAFENAVRNAVEGCLSMNADAVSRYACRGNLLDHLFTEMGQSLPVNLANELLDWSQTPCGRTVESTFPTRLPMRDAQGRWGYVDETGAWAMPGRWRQVAPFSEGRAVVLNGNDWALIDSHGEVIAAALVNYRSVGYGDEFAIPPLSKFENGCAVFDNGEGRRQWLDREGRQLTIDSVPGMADIDVREIGAFSNGLAAFGVRSPETGQIEWGYLSSDGVVVIEPQFREASQFGQAANQQWLAQVARSNAEDRIERGYIDADGHWLSDAPFHDATAFREGAAMVKTASRAHWQVFDGTTLHMNALPIRSVYRFAEGRAVVAREAFWEDLVVIDANGQAVFEFKSKGICLALSNQQDPQYQNGYLAVLVPREGDDCGPGVAISGFHSYANGRLTYLDQNGDIVVQEP